MTSRKLSRLAFTASVAGLLAAAGAAAQPGGEAARIADLKARTAALVKGGSAAAAAATSPVIWRVPGAVERIVDCADACPEMMVLPAGAYTMGSPATEAERAEAEGPQHRVIIGYPLAVGRFVVTRAQYARFVEASGHTPKGEPGCRTYRFAESKWILDPAADWRKPGFDQGGSDPAVCVSWEDAKAYTAWLSARTGHVYRLLSSAEWEYAARAGTTTTYSFGDAISPEKANYNGTYAYPAATVNGLFRRRPVAVGSFPANPFGLHEMSGNVWEWTEDCFVPTHAGAPANGAARTDGDCGERMLRGGSWASRPGILRSARSSHDHIDVRFDAIGFRVAREL